MPVMFLLSVSAAISLLYYVPTLYKFVEHLKRDHAAEFEALGRPSVTDAALQGPLFALLFGWKQLPPSVVGETRDLLRRARIALAFGLCSVIPLMVMAAVFGNHG